MTGAGFRELGEAHRTWLRRFATTASVAILLSGLYEALPRNPSCPQLPHPKPGVGYACDPSGPTYHHPAFWLSLAACAVVALILTRRFLADEAS
jgi:hypothetical protein